MNKLSSDQKLFDELSQHHPEYDKWKSEWQLYSDVLGDQGAFNKEQYLPKGKSENVSLYKLRTSLAEFIPDSPLAIDKMVGALFKDKPKRELKPHSGLDEFVEDVDLEGSKMDEFQKKILDQLLGYGCIRCLINTKYPDDIKGNLTRKQEQVYNVRQYAILYNPLSVIDWDYDKYNALNMVRLIESEERAKPDRSHVKIQRFIEYTRETVEWWEFEEVEGRWTRIGTDKREHGLGVVPMVCVNLRKISRMVGKSFIRYSARADIQKFQAESDLAYDTYVHAHPSLKVHTKRKLSEIGVGANSYNKLSPENPKEDISYIVPPESCFSSLRHQINEKRAAVYRQAKTDPMGVVEASNNIFQASGVARAWSFGTSEARILTDLADKMEDIERLIFEVVLRYQTPTVASAEDKLFSGSIQYPEEFDLASVQDLLNDSVVIKEQINSPLLLRTIYKRIAASKIGNTSTEILNKIFSEIDKNEILGMDLEVPLDMPPPFENDEEEDDDSDEG